MPADALQLVEDADRASVDEMLKLNGLLDVIIPRGGASLIRTVVANATVPVIETGAGICHTYVDESADEVMATDIAINAKAQRPSVCNSMETLLLHANYAEKHLSTLAERFREANVALKGCETVRRLVPTAAHATEEDYATEYNDYILNIRVVENLDEALQHIAHYGTKHSECIVTQDAAHAERFLQEVDAAAVYHNLSPFHRRILNSDMVPRSESVHRSCMHGANGAACADVKQIPDYRQWSDSSIIFDNQLYRRNDIHEPRSNRHYYNKDYFPWSRRDG